MQRLLLVGYVVTLALTGCGGPATAQKAEVPRSPAIEKRPEGNAGADAAAPAQGTAAGKVPAEAPAAEASAAEKVKAEAEEPIRAPATVAEAAKAIDLSTFPLMPGAKVADQLRVVASLHVHVPADVKTAYEFHRQALVERGWKESGEASVSDASATASFAKDGFRLVLSMFPSEPGQVLVILQNRGSLNLAKLPVPPGAKTWHTFPQVASFITDAGLAETTAAVRTLLMEQGWEPYGSAGDVMYFKQNAVKLHARVLSPPAVPGKTVIDYSCEQLSADLPAPPDAERVDYYDALKRVTAYKQDGADALMDFYRAKLPAAGWQATTENPIQDHGKRMLIYRNSAKDMLTLNVYDGNDQVMARATVEHLTAAEVAEIDRQIDIEQENLAEKRRKEEEERNKPKPKVLVTLPAEAREVEATPDEIEFKVASGKAAAVLDVIIKQFEAEGWKLDKPLGSKEAGTMSLEKGEQKISITYIDPGFIPGQITLTAWGKFELERAGSGKK
jgi:hypothetical protein